VRAWEEAKEKSIMEVTKIEAVNQHMFRALKLIELTPGIRDWLTAHDPEALKQVCDAVKQADEHSIECAKEREFEKRFGTNRAEGCEISAEKLVDLVRANAEGKEQLMLIRVKQLILLVGLPRCGKTTYANNLRVQLGLKRVSVSIVSPDDIRFAIYGKYGLRFDRDSEPLVWFIVRTCVRAAFERNDIVVLDATNLTRGDREKWLSKEWFCQYVVFHDSKDVCIRRAQADGRHDLVSVIERMDERKELELTDEKSKGLVLQRGWHQSIPDRPRL
jgi:predicted kinase